tara:strand:- start:235 stop:423 length:189 start_codon:yes stop_codon:yes gene_type:complete
MPIELTKSDEEYAHQHGLTFGEMRGFVEDQINEEEMKRTWFEEKEKVYKDFKNSPQSIYTAW